MTPEQWVRVNRVYRGVSTASACVAALAFAVDGDLAGSLPLGAFTLLCLVAAFGFHRRVVR